MLSIEDILMGLRCESPEGDKQEESGSWVIINGLKWDKTNMEVQDSKGRIISYFQFDKANELAKSRGKRLPTSEEWQALADLGSTWDDALKGRWFGHDNDKKIDSKQSIFLPAMGFDSYNDKKRLNGALALVGSYGYYWSGTPYSATYGRHLYFSSTGVSPQDTSYRALGFAARCVAG